MLQTDRSVKLEEEQSFELLNRRQRLWSEKEATAFWDRQEGSRQKMHDALTEVLMVGSVEALRAAKSLDEAHLLVTGSLGDAGEVDTMDEREAEIGNLFAAEKKLRARSDAFLAIVRENLGAE
jgi:hypothetical protein